MPAHCKGRLSTGMQKVIVVSKTHLDLGFTDYAEHIYHKYLDEFIPNAVSIANELNDLNVSFGRQAPGCSRKR